MARRAFVLAAVASGLAATASCRSACGERHGWFTSAPRDQSPGRLVGQSGACDSCFEPTAGGSFPGGAGMVIPGPGRGMPSFPGTELPMPGPAGQIPPPVVPFAPPSVAPPTPGGESGMSVLPPPKFGVPVGGGK